MKRKLDQNDTPAVIDQKEVVAEAQAAEKPAAATAAAPEPILSFTELGLDPRLIQAVAQQKFEKPTLVQQRAIPLALNGQDVLAKAKTGSGKTAAYLLPILQAILKRKQVRNDSTLPCPYFMEIRVIDNLSSP